MRDKEIEEELRAALEDRVIPFQELLVAREQVMLPQVCRQPGRPR
jgi:hypothetical protein